jgi:hypothetical protein
MMSTTSRNETVRPNLFNRDDPSRILMVDLIALSASSLWAVFWFRALFGSLTMRKGLLEVATHSTAVPDCHDEIALI